MFGLGWSETVFLFVLALIVIGPKQLPEVAKTVGRFINELKRTANSLKGEFHSVTSEDLFAETTRTQELPAPDGSDSNGAHSDHQAHDDHQFDAHSHSGHHGDHKDDFDHQHDEVHDGHRLHNDDQLAFDLNAARPASSEGSSSHEDSEKKKTDG